jgi:hypothetical protein
MLCNVYNLARLGRLGLGDACDQFLLGNAKATTYATESVKPG